MSIHVKNREKSAEEISNDELVREAKQGNQEAFGELVRRSRYKALNTAQSIVKDVHLAEDIVQDALIRAFLKMGELASNNRFQGWLHRIVRNESLMKIRKSSYKNEKPVTHYAKNSHEGKHHGIDSLLSQLQKGIEHRGTSEPSTAYLQKEFLNGVHELLTCLSEQERKVFDAFFFGQLDPKEISALLHIPPKNVHGTLYKARKKVQRERIRVHINDFVQRRRAEHLPVRKVLPTPPDF